MRIGCWVPWAASLVVTSVSFLGAREGSVGERPGEGRTDAGLEGGELLASDDLEVLVGLELRDDVLGRGVGDDELEPDEVVVQASVGGAYRSWD